MSKFQASAIRQKLWQEDASVKPFKPYLDDAARRAVTQKSRKLIEDRAAMYGWLAVCQYCARRTVLEGQMHGRQTSLRAYKSEAEQTDLNFDQHTSKLRQKFPELTCMPIPSWKGRSSSCIMSCCPGLYESWGKRGPASLMLQIQVMYVAVLEIFQL